MDKFIDVDGNEVFRITDNSEIIKKKKETKEDENNQSKVLPRVETDNSNKE